MATLAQIANLVPEERRAVAKSLVTELNFMRRTLVSLRKHVDEHGATVWFKNGSQEMWRENPSLKSYTALIARYATLSRQLVSMVPEDEQPEADELDQFLAGNF